MGPFTPIHNHFEHVLVVVSHSMDGTTTHGGDSWHQTIVCSFYNLYRSVACVTNQDESENVWGEGIVAEHDGVC